MVPKHYSLIYCNSFVSFQKIFNACDPALDGCVHRTNLDMRLVKINKLCVSDKETQTEVFC